MYWISFLTFSFLTCGGRPAFLREVTGDSLPFGGAGVEAAEVEVLLAVLVAADGEGGQASCAAAMVSPLSAGFTSSSTLTELPLTSAAEAAAPSHPWRPSPTAGLTSSAIPRPVGFSSTAGIGSILYSTSYFVARSAVNFDYARAAATLRDPAGRNEGSLGRRRIGPATTAALPHTWLSTSSLRARRCTKPRRRRARRKRSAVEA